MAVKKMASVRMGGGLNPPKPPSGYATAEMVPFCGENKNVILATVLALAVKRKPVGLSAVSM